MAIENYGILLLGIVVGFGLGELLEELGKKTAKIVGTVIVGILDLTSIFVKFVPQLVPIFGWGVFI